MSCASCNDLPGIKIPTGETCFTSLNQPFGTLLCEDTTFPKDDPRREYDRQLGRNDVVTNSDDYFKYRSEFIEAKKDAASWKKKYEAACKISPKVCQ